MSASTTEKYEIRFKTFAAAFELFSVFSYILKLALILRIDQKTLVERIMVPKVWEKLLKSSCDLKPVSSDTLAGMF